MTLVRNVWLKWCARGARGDQCRYPDHTPLLGGGVSHTQFGRQCSLERPLGSLSEMLAKMVENRQNRSAREARRCCKNGARASRGHHFGKIGVPLELSDSDVFSGISASISASISARLWGSLRGWLSRLRWGERPPPGLGGIRWGYS